MNYIVHISTKDSGAILFFFIFGNKKALHIDLGTSLPYYNIVIM